jgi:DegV family protein with EDD domain
MGRQFVILPDVCCDLNKQLREEYSIDYVPCHMTTPDGEEHLTLLDWDEMGMEHDSFYDDLKKRPSAYSTAPASTEEFALAFEKFVKQDKDVLSITISGGMSVTYRLACQAADIVKEKYPQAHIRLIDSRRFSAGYGLLCIKAAELRAQGMGVDEVADYIEANKNRVHQIGWLDDLSFTAKKGRITNAKAFFGTLAGIKPIGEFDYNGMTTVIAKVKGEKKAYRVLLDYMQNVIENPEEQIVLIAQSKRLEQAKAYKQMIEERFHPKKVYITDVFTACGINVGLGLMAAYVFGKTISQNLAEERALLESLNK